MFHSQPVEIRLGDHELTLPELQAALKGIVSYCDNILKDENNSLVDTVTMRPYNEQYSMMLRQLKRRSRAVFQNMEPRRLEDYQWDSTRLNREYLYALRNDATYALQYVESALANEQDDSPKSESSSIDLVCRILRRFSSALQRLQNRSNNKPSLLTINNEKDLQDVIHCFLQLHFDDIRREEPVPSHAGAGSLIDFLLKSERIGIEVKGPREGLKDIKAGAQLLEDISKYRQHPDCQTLILFIYDPSFQLVNPAGIINDLEKASSPNFRILAIIVPPRH